MNDNTETTNAYQNLTPHQTPHNLHHLSFMTPSKFKTHKKFNPNAKHTSSMKIITQFHKTNKPQKTKKISRKKKIWVNQNGYMILELKSVVIKAKIFE